MLAGSATRGEVLVHLLGDFGWALLGMVHSIAMPIVAYQSLQAGANLQDQYFWIVIRSVVRDIRVLISSHRICLSVSVCLLIVSADCVIVYGSCVGLLNFLLAASTSSLGYGTSSAAAAAAAAAACLS